MVKSGGSGYGDETHRNQFWKERTHRRSSRIRWWMVRVRSICPGGLVLQIAWIVLFVIVITDKFMSKCILLNLPKMRNIVIFSIPMLIFTRDT